MRPVDDPKISIIVPVYKVEPYLRKCLDSIVNQTYQNLEIILVDDGSPDNCGAICDEYAAKDERIQVIHKENGGVSSARNAGLEAASGDWVGFVDSDDWVEPDMFAYLLESAQTYHADVAICGFLNFLPNGAAGNRFCCDKTMLLDTEKALEAFLQNQYISLSCCDKLARYNLWKQVRFPDIRIGEDFLAVCQLLENAKCTICLPEVKYCYYTRPGGGLSSEDLGDRISSWETAMEYYTVFSTRWPQLAPLLAEKCGLMAAGIWGVYYSAEKSVRKKMAGKMEIISAFCREHIQNTVLHSGTGRAGKLVLQLTPFPTWWAFALAWAVNWLYQIKYKRPL